MSSHLKLLTFAGLLVSLVLAPVISTAATPAKGYHNYQALTASLKQIAAKNQAITKLSAIGKTLKGRNIWLIQISGTKGPKATEKQALLICANAEADHVIGSEVALGIADFLISNYGKNEKVTKVLDQRTFYIAPRLNPDGAELFFGKTLNEYSGNLKPRDDDYDWLVDEDGPEDLNGDGMITVMRVKDRDGDWVVDVKDPRLMKKKSGNTPKDKLYKIYSEGIDNDGDDLFNEDGPGGFNINRNFPHNFGYKQKGLGVYPTSEVETRALIDFMTKYIPQLKTQPHRNICSVLVFSKFDNLAASPGISSGTPTFPQGTPTRAAAGGGGGMGGMMMFRMGRRGGAQAQQRPAPRDPQPKTTNGADMAIFNTVSSKYKEITGIRSASSDKPFGSILEYGYFQQGVPTFSANLFSLRQGGRTAPSMRRQPGSQTPTRSATSAGSANRTAMMQQYMAGGGGQRAMPGGGRQAASQSNNDAGWLKWIDTNNKGQGFVSWSTFNHKQLGEVEIGGFQPYLRVNPPAGEIKKLSESHAKFALFLATQFAEISLGKPQVKKLAANLYELKLTVRNGGEFPYVTAMGQRTGKITPIVLRLKFEDEKKMKFFGGSGRIDIRSLAPDAENEYKWVIISPAGKKVDISLWARNGGGTTKTRVVLK